MSRTRIPFNYEDLHPKARDHFRLLAVRLEQAHKAGHTRDLIKPFEGFRPAENQRALVAAKVSKAMPWQSAHNYGLAVDYVPWRPGMGFHWPDASHNDWKVLGEMATTYGLWREIAWDKPHVESPIWHAIRSHLV